MFEYNAFLLKVYGFSKIDYLDEVKIIFRYKKRKLVITGKDLKAVNLIDRSLEIKGIIEEIKLLYIGDYND